jgi:hypothetical protein
VYGVEVEWTQWMKEKEKEREREREREKDMRRGKGYHG